MCIEKSWRNLHRRICQIQSQHEPGSNLQGKNLKKIMLKILFFIDFSISLIYLLQDDAGTCGRDLCECDRMFAEGKNNMF